MVRAFTLLLVDLGVILLSSCTKKLQKVVITAFLLDTYCEKQGGIVW